MGEACTKLGDLALGVVKPWPGQEDMYCGNGSCGAFKEMFLNALVPVRYAKLAINASSAVATGVAIAITGNNSALTAFANAVGDSALANTGYPAAHTLTLSETNYQPTERPVPDNSNKRFCLVGISTNIENPYDASTTAGTQTFPDWLTQVAEYRETMRASLLNNAVLSMAKGNNRCAFQLGLLKHFHGANQVSGGDLVAAGNADAGPLQYTPLNAVVVMESYVGAERMTLGLTLNHPIQISPTSVAVTAVTTILIPVEIEMFGFIIEVPGSGSFYESLPEAQKPAGVRANAQGWR